MNNPNKTKISILPNGSSRIVRFGWKIILIDTIISLFLGSLAALAGGSFTKLGNGFGGGNGIPDLIFTIPILIGLFLVLRSVIKKEDNKSFWLFAFIGPLIISFGYVLIAHTFDPCYNGFWDMSSRIDGRIMLCERFGSEINIHTRFHYLWHILPTLPLVWLYWGVLKKRLPEVFDKNLN